MLANTGQFGFASGSVFRKVTDDTRPKRSGQPASRDILGFAHVIRCNF